MADFVKDPSEVLDYDVDWSNWLATGETISTSSFVVTAGITIDSDTNDSTIAKVWLSSGTAGNSYTVTNTITTSASRTAERSFVIDVQER